MRNRLKFLAMKQISHRRAVAKIDVVHGHVIGNTCNVCVFYLRIIKIIEVVEDGDLMSGREQLLDKMRPNETGAACNEDSHSSEVQPRRTRSARRNFLNFTASVYLPSRFVIFVV